MIFEYAQLRGTLDGMNTTVITELAEYYEKEIGYKIPPRTPFVGKNFNVTRAGIHADGLLKDAEIYTIFDTNKLLNRPATNFSPRLPFCFGLFHQSKNILNAITITNTYPSILTIPSIQPPLFRQIYFD